MIRGNDQLIKRTHRSLKSWNKDEDNSPQNALQTFQKALNLNQHMQLNPNPQLALYTKQFYRMANV